MQWDYDKADQNSLKSYILTLLVEINYIKDLTLRGLKKYVCTTRNLQACWEKHKKIVLNSLSKTKNLLVFTTYKLLNSECDLRIIIICHMLFISCKAIFSAIIILILLSEENSESFDKIYVRNKFSQYYNVCLFFCHFYRLIEIVAIK